jgi:hypothetical protein
MQGRAGRRMLGRLPPGSAEFSQINGLRELHGEAATCVVRRDTSQLWIDCLIKEKNSAELLI